MKKHITLLLLLLFTGSTYAQTVTSEEIEQRDNLWYLVGSNTLFSGDLHDKDALKGRIENGRREGRWTAWHDNGAVSWETDYDAGVMNYHAMYYPNGTTRFQGTFSEGRQDGTSKTWYASGTLQSETEYAMGQRNGERKLWDPQGALLYSARYTANKLDGPSIWWYDNGQKRWATYYKRGEKWGVWTQWTRKGRILRQSDWKDGKMVIRNAAEEG